MDEAQFGAQIRRARLLEDIDQRALADAANISPTTLMKLEKGQGSTLTTLLKVLRALGREDWLATLEPVPTVSPLALAREAEGRQEPQRVSRKKTP
ncbi:helix-turn-helix transcriptional regulator [Microbacterium sp. C5A9]|uniref:helix-turn-helix domain-containing protein n=1 Tax=Microbacterium sp. C5A9 TaxID=2736663 RepID=UPI001F515839|nr:helix-turn-helix transcriptional regulator [Microbacterium sp. C5A9]MCI1017226.1 helix-turn-helix transcriptional regulator [Microbacterium sp. C5A9]